MITNDPLSLILNRFGVAGSVFCRAELGTPWSISTRGSGAPGSDRPAIFHVIVRGEGFVHVQPDRDTITSHHPSSWRSGDVILMPHGDPHILCSATNVPPVSIISLPAPAGPDGLPCVTHGGDGPTTSVLCGTIRFSPDADELLRPHLPPLLHLRCEEDSSAAWLDATLRLLGAEASSQLPGAETVVAKLAEVLFVQALRAWIKDAPDGKAGWLAALEDPQLAQVLGLIHEEPATAWTAASLARRAGLSRSVLYTRFTEIVGEPPASYLTRWRMHVARRALRQGASLAQAAEEVGYNSEAAFSRAFKRTVGASPSAWRAAQQAAQEHSRTINQYGVLAHAEAQPLTWRAPSAVLAEVENKIPILQNISSSNPLSQNNIQGWISVSNAREGQALFALYAKGPSMTSHDELREDDLLIIRQQRVAEEGDLVLASLDASTRVGRLRQHEGQLALFDGSSPEPMTLSSIRIQGKIVGLRRDGF